jgi:tetratricopeptide (TPR) repeat protein
MKPPPLASVDNLNRMIQAANECCLRGDFRQGAELFERASRIGPANWQLLLQSGRAYFFDHDYAAAERCFEEVVRMVPHNLEALTAMGRLSFDHHQHRMAEAYLRRAVEQPGATVDTVARLAAIYERLHRLEDAAAMAERALHLDNACPSARLTQAKVHRQAGRLAEAEQALRPILTAADREFQVRGYYELGGIYDRQERYDEAMTAFLEAKALLLPDAPPLLAQMQSTIRNAKDMENNVSADLLQRWRDSGRELTPAHRLAFLGGHARSGTTLLEQVLDSHPDIVTADETFFFYFKGYGFLTHHLPEGTSVVAGLEAAQTGALRQARANYFRSMESHLGHPIGQRVLVDKNPTFQELILGYVRIFPEIKLIVALRDPRDVVLSCFTLPHWPMGRGNVTFLNLEGTVENYTRTMGLWRTLKPLIKNPCLEVRYEDMVEDLEAEARRTLDFLGVPWDPRVLAFYEHARKKALHAPTYADVTQPIYKRAAGRWRNYQKYLEPHLGKLEPFIKAFGYE